MHIYKFSGERTPCGVLSIDIPGIAYDVLTITKSNENDPDAWGGKGKQLPTPNQVEPQSTRRRCTEIRSQVNQSNSGWRQVYIVLRTL